jgi:hypothetical protein
VQKARSIWKLSARTWARSPPGWPINHPPSPSLPLASERLVLLLPSGVLGHRPRNPLLPPRQLLSNLLVEHGIQTLWLQAPRPSRAPHGSAEGPLPSEAPRVQGEAAAAHRPFARQVLPLLHSSHFPTISGCILPGRYFVQRHRSRWVGRRSLTLEGEGG